MVAVTFNPRQLSPAVPVAPCGNGSLEPPLVAAASVLSAYEHVDTVDLQYRRAGPVGRILVAVNMCRILAEAIGV